MEWSIPLQKLEIDKLQLDTNFNLNEKPNIKFKYVDRSITFNTVTILLPSLSVKEYDPQTGKLVLNLSNNLATYNKLLALQESLLSKVYQQQNIWFNSSSSISKEQLTSFFQPFLRTNYLLDLYYPLQQNDKYINFNIWKDNKWKQNEAGHIKAGDTLRIAFRLYGLSFQVVNSEWSGRFRVQHRISCVYSCK